MDDYSTFGQRVKMHRLRLGLSQEELGKRLNLKYGAISNWETDLTFPTAPLLPSLASIFGISIDELLGYVPARYSDKTYRAMDTFEDLDDASQDFILNMMETLPHRPKK